MIASRRLRLQLFAQNAVFAVLLVVAAVLLAHFAQQYSKQWDLTQNARNTLSEGSQQLLKQLKGPVAITAYVGDRDPNLGDIRRQIADFVARYQRVKPDVTLAYIDPREQPKLAKDANVQVPGEMVIEYQGRREHLTALDEQALTSMLTRLSRNQERTVMFLDGHGERKPDGIANHDLGTLGKRLVAAGIRTNTLRLAEVQDVPANVALLVIAAPQVDLLPVEVSRIRGFLDRGGNLLWLIDQEPLHGLQPIADFLGLQLSPGIAVDPAAQALRQPGTLSISSAYGQHPAMRGFTLTTAFPFARRIAHAEENKTWRYTPLVEVAQTGWLENSPLGDSVAFDKNRDMPGPVTVAAALERDVDGRHQRIVVTGSGHFLSNTSIGLLGNLDLGMNLVNWLAGDDSMVAVQPRTLVDGELQLTRSSLIFIALFFLIALPGFFLFTGVMNWWRRRS
jgi:ABC-type uncharacterized transport system involved in gliding motility auxiliary subunit